MPKNSVIYDPIGKMVILSLQMNAFLMPLPLVVIAGHCEPDAAGTIQKIVTF
jgi:hypothetical protein